MTEGTGTRSSRCKAVTMDRRTATRLRILCRNEEEVKNFKRAATAIAGERVIRDQLYSSVKVNNARADAVPY